MKQRFLIGALAGAAALSASGGAFAAPSLRAQVTQKGDFVLIGNTLGQDCANAGSPVIGTVGTCPASDSNFGPDVFWQADSPTAGQATASTAIGAAGARTTAVLTLPAGAAVSNAYLYWGARPSSTTTDNAVVLDRPGTGGFTANVTALAAITATGNNLPPPGSNLAYQSVADITQLVKQNGAGAYRISGVDSVDVGQINLPNLAVGWWMVVFYNDNTQPLRQLTLFDGLDYVNNAAGGATSTLSGFLVPNAGYTAHLGVIAYGGDDASQGDQLLWNGTALGDAQNPTNNFFNSSRSFLGAPVSVVGDLPQLTGVHGSMSELDLDVIDITGNVTPGQSSATIQATSSGDSYFLGGFITSISTFAPDFTGSTKSVADITSGTNAAHPGDILEYTITITNTGTDTSTNTVLTDAIPAGVTYVPGSLQIVAGANTGAKTDGAADDQADYNAGANAVTFRLGTGANGTSGGTLVIGGSSTVKFRVQINAGATGTILNQGTITASGLMGAPTQSFATNGNGPPPNSSTGITIANCPIASCGCLLDVDCGGPTSGMVCDNALIGGSFTCIPGCRGIGGNGCMSGLSCTSTTTAIGTCVTSGGCNVDSDCSGGKWCDESMHLCTAKLTNGSTLPNDPPHTGPTLNGTCTTAAAVLVCQSGVCDTSDNRCGYADGDGPCSLATGGIVCRSGACSTNGLCMPAGGCNVDTDCTGGNWCDESTHTCTPKLANGTAIPTDAPHMGPTLNGTCTAAAALLVCQSGVCDTADNRCGYANGDGPCSLATGNVVCRSSVCSATGGICVPTGGCAVDADCAADQWCNTPTFMCTPKLPNGQGVPTAAGHTPTLDGTCTVAAGAATCASGVCDTNDNLCGYADGDGPCTMMTGSVVCRSGTCATDGTCAPSGGCNVDADCPTDQWCNESMHACTPKLGNGTALPNDPPHTGPTLDGTCTTAAAMVVCASGVCDTKDNACGYANGDGPCTAADGADTCRSTICASAGPNEGLCVACVMSSQCPATAPICTDANTCAQCATDSDCGGPMSGKVCDVTTGMCGDGCRGMNGNGCPSGDTCTSADITVGQCVQCRDDSDCGGPASGKVCNPMTNTCGDGCRGTNGNGCPSGETCSSTDSTIGMCSNGGMGGGGTGGSNDGFTASGNGLICAAQPGRSGDDGSMWLLGGLAGAILAFRRRRR